MTFPLPDGLLPFLHGRGLGIYCLPRNPKFAGEIYSQRLGFRKNYVDGHFMDTAFYCTYSKRVVLSHKALFENPFGNVVLHEIGHAFDYLYDWRGSMLSSFPEIIKAVRPKKPLLPYCERKDKAFGLPREQFAYSFEAYFQEPEADLSQLHIGLLSKKFITIMNELLEPFKNGPTENENGTQK